MRRVGGAHRGLDMWLVQRASAAYMAIYLLVLAWMVIGAEPLDFTAWHGLFTPLVAKVASLLFIASVLAHAWIGLREVFIDYLHVVVLRLALYLLFGGLYLGCLVWSVDILWSVR